VALNIKNQQVEDLATQVADLTGQTKTESIRQALERRRAELLRQGRPPNRTAAARRFFEHEVWPLIPPDQLGKQLSRAEEDDILGYGPEGV
jgi:antitoxin VapB